MYVDSNARTGSQPSLELRSYKGKEKEKKEENKLDTSCYMYVAKKGQREPTARDWNKIGIKGILRERERERRKGKETTEGLEEHFFSGAKSFKSHQ